MLLLVGALTLGAGLPCAGSGHASGPRGPVPAVDNSGLEWAGQSHLCFLGISAGKAPGATARLDSPRSPLPSAPSLVSWPSPRVTAQAHEVASTRG